MTDEEGKAIAAEFEACGIKVISIPSWYGFELEFPSGAQLVVGGDAPPYHGVEYDLETLEQRRERVRSYGSEPDF